MSKAKNWACPKCKGIGSVEDRSEGACDNCRGRGRIKFVSLSGITFTPCETCRGRGKVPTILIRKCRACYGTGIMNYEEAV